jgi:DNA repair protein SbcD/Mre11
LGAEKLLAVGRGFTIPLSLLTRDCFDYVALGHVHRHQNLNKTNDPAVVYPGSIERVDFSEEKEEKGFVMVTISPREGFAKEPTAQREEQPASKNFETTWEFCPLPVRAFRTIKIDVSESEHPQADIEKAIAKVDIDDVVVRLIYQLSPDRVELVNTAALHQALSSAHHYTIQAELISQLSRPRLPELGCSVGDPMVALSTYLENRPDLASIAQEMIAAANELLAGDRSTAAHLDNLVMLDLESSTDAEIEIASTKQTKSKQVKEQLTLL